MFEKKAEEAGNEKIKGNYQFARCARKSYKDGFKDGAEFGYNKAKAEKKRLIDILDLWIESCERFYDTFKNDFVKRLDAVKELKVRCDKVHFMNKFLQETHVISTDKYLEIADRHEKVFEKLRENEYTEFSEN